MTVELRRKAYDKLLEWKRTSNGSSAILINGARRVGKSHLAEEFAKREYKEHVIINFSDSDDEIATAFMNEKWSSKTFLESVEILTGKRLPPRDTVIIFDEVQLYPRARQMIKYLVIDGRYDYIETGSLISIKANVQNIVIPSEEDDLLMFPLDFEEFLWAIGNETVIPFLRERLLDLHPVGETMHREIMRLFRKYMLVGGMPQAVVKYVETESFIEADSMKKKILSLYRKDISKYASGYQQRVYSIFDSIPSQLSRKDKKFKIGSVEKDAKSREYETAFIWLADGMVVNPCVNATDPTVGLAMNTDLTTQKLYMADTGLLITACMSDDDATDDDLYKSLYLGKLGVNEGMFAENIVSQCLRSNGHQLYFYYRPAKKAEDEGEEDESALEIDFLIRRGGKICPLEVKSSARIRHDSLDRFVKKFGKRIGAPYLLCLKDIHEKDGIVYLPLYMAAVL